MTRLKPRGAHRRTTSPTHRRAVDHHLISVVAASLLALAAVVYEAPVGIRLIAAAVLLLVPGVALMRLLLPRKEVRGTDPALVIPLSMLLGVLAWLGVVLLLNGFGVRLSPTTMAATLTAFGLLLAGWTIKRAGLVEPGVAPVRRALTRRARTAAAVLTAAALLTGAAGLAVAVIPTPSAPYTTLGFVDDKPFGAGTPVVAAGSTVRLNWVVRGFGCVLSAALTSVRLAIDGVPVGDVAVDVSPVATPDVDGSSGSISGAVTFAAPTDTGKHTVELFVLPTAADGIDLPAPGYISTLLEVAR